MPPKPTGRAPRGTGRGRGRPRASQGRTATDAESQPEPAATTAEVTAPAPLTAAPVTAVAARAESSESGAVEVTPKLPSTSASAKFRPKGIRRAEAERDKIAQEQLRLQNERIAEDARAQARANRLRGRGASRGRGRGGIPGRPFGGPAAVGPFGNPCTSKSMEAWSSMGRVWANARTRCCFRRLSVWSRGTRWCFGFRHPLRCRIPRLRWEQARRWNISWARGRRSHIYGSRRSPH